MDVRPIATEAEYNWALQAIEPYFTDEPAQETPASARLTALATLIKAYEDKHWPIQGRNPFETAPPNHP